MVTKMQDLNKTAHKILDVAERYTQTNGFNAFSYKDIQNEVGVKTSSIHYYFPTKQDLAMTMVQRYVERFTETLNLIEAEEQNGFARLKRLGQGHKSLVEEGKFCMCGMMASDMLSLPDNVKKQLSDFFDLSQEWIARAIDLAKQQGQLRDSIHVKCASMHFLASLEGGMLVARVKDDPQYLQDIIDEALAQLAR